MRIGGPTRKGVKILDSVEVCFGARFPLVVFCLFTTGSSRVVVARVEDGILAATINLPLQDCCKFNLSHKSCDQWWCMFAYLLVFTLVLCNFFLSAIGPKTSLPKHPKRALCGGGGAAAACWEEAWGKECDRCIFLAGSLSHPSFLK